MCIWLKTNLQVGGGATVNVSHPVVRQNQHRTTDVDSLRVSRTESTRASDRPSLRPRCGVGLSRTSRTGRRESRAPAATPRVETHRHPSAASTARSPVLDRAGQDVAPLARRARARPARHRGAMASRLASPTMDAALGAHPSRSANYRGRHSDARAHDGGCQSTLGSLCLLKSPFLLRQLVDVAAADGYATGR